MVQYGYYLKILKFASLILLIQRYLMGTIAFWAVVHPRRQAVYNVQTKCHNLNGLQDTPDQQRHQGTFA